MTETRTPYQALTPELRRAINATLTATGALNRATTALADAHLDELPILHYSTAVLDTYRTLLRALENLNTLAPPAGRRPSTQWTISNAGQALERADWEHRAALDDCVPAEWSDGSY